MAVIFINSHSHNLFCSKANLHIPWQSFVKQTQIFICDHPVLINDPPMPFKEAVSNVPCLTACLGLLSDPAT